MRSRTGCSSTRPTIERSSATGEVGPLAIAARELLEAGLRPSGPAEASRRGLPGPQLGDRPHAHSATDGPRDPLQRDPVLARPLEPDLAARGDGDDLVAGRAADPLPAHPEPRVLPANPQL